MIFIINEKDEQKVTEFLRENKIEAETSNSLLKSFLLQETKYRINEAEAVYIENQEYLDSLTNEQKEVLYNDITSELYDRSEEVLDSDVLIEIINEVIGNWKVL